VAKPFRYHFEWDPSKARQNIRKHGIPLDRAASIFLDPNALSDFDEPHSEREDRWVTLGLDNQGTLLVVCHTFQDTSDTGARVRLISARKATKAEAAQYRRH
jgi:uncharacterized DUF497 family protein